ncbi:hypothetical protein BN863_30950 [Formosa agariphila KMM 3901]|uniref:Uncharacterized protein n=2 Tax=Formosa TaxID=225842 RepID=T2KPS4_FORAG|nr:hypothetical protein BN863_30950 [Formosa agariphila KMM 3901]
MVIACETDDSVYDVDWPVPEIFEVSSFNEVLSNTIKLTGEFEKVDNVYFGDVVGDNLKVSDDEKSLQVDVPRTMNVDGAPIVVSNKYGQQSETAANFVPIIPSTEVKEVSDIQVGLNFKVIGINVDLLTEVTVNGEVVDEISKTTEESVFSVADLDLKAGMLVDVAFKSLANDEIPVAKKVEVIYPFISYDEVVVWDFKDGTHQYVGEGDASVKTGDFNGTDINYFSLRAPGYGWDKESGNMTSEEVPDVSGLINPFLTFAVRTPAGSAGYFQLEDQAGNWRHFGYGFDTGGQWVIVSQPLEDNWEGGEFNSGAFKPKLTFKSGNAGANQDLDIAFFKITEGQYDGSQEIGDALVGSTKPSKITVMGFEDSGAWPDIYNNGNLVASLDLRTNEIDPFFGNQFYTYTDDGSLGNWGGYWGQSISKEMKSSQLSVFNDPYVSLALNSIPDETQYIIVRMFQYDEQLVLIQKFFPNTNGKWETFQFSLFNSDMENWSDSTTELGQHYASLKRFNKDAPLDRIEVIVNRNDGNEIGVSIDDMVITEGPRY